MATRNNFGSTLKRGLRKKKRIKKAGRVLKGTAKERFVKSRNTKKGAKKAVDITGLFQWSGVGCLDTDGDEAITQADFDQFKNSTFLIKPIEQNKIAMITL